MIEKIHYGAISSQKRQASENRQQKQNNFQQSKYSASQVEKEYKLRAIDKLISVIKVNDDLPLSSTNNSQHLPSVQTAYGGTRNNKSEAVTKNYETTQSGSGEPQQYSKHFPRKYSQVVPSSGKKDANNYSMYGAGGGPKETITSSSAMNSTNNIYKKISQKRPTH